jgi:hypothetical protein
MQMTIYYLKHILIMVRMTSPASSTSGHQRVSLCFLPPFAIVAIVTTFTTFTIVAPVGLYAASSAVCLDIFL